MTRTELIALLSERWQEHFADEAASRVCDADAVGELYRLVTALPGEIPRSLRHTLLFRGAYVLERIYFRDRSAFGPCAEDFCRSAFPACMDPSARRHFGKIMVDLLEHTRPDVQMLDRIAGTAAEWASDPSTKVAVRVWAMEVLKRCRGRVAWVEEVWEDLLELQCGRATAGIESRMRRSWRPNPSARTEDAFGK